MEYKEVVHDQQMEMSLIEYMTQMKYILIIVLKKNNKDEDLIQSLPIKIR